MIFGIGSDLVDIARIEALLARFGEAFVHKILSPSEQTGFYAKPIGRRASFLAKRFAAKEALLKALGTGLAHGMCWHHMEISSNKDGAPQARLTGAARLQALDKNHGQDYRVHLTISDSQHLAQAFVILESL